MLQLLKSKPVMETAPNRPEACSREQAEQSQSLALNLELKDSEKRNSFQAGWLEETLGLTAAVLSLSDPSCWSRNDSHSSYSQQYSLVEYQATRHHWHLSDLNLFIFINLQVNQSPSSGQKKDKSFSFYLVSFISYREKKQSVVMFIFNVCVFDVMLH